MLKQHIIRKMIIPFIAAIIGYYTVAVTAYYYVFSQPHPQFGTMLKYIISLLFDCADINRFQFNLPDEYAADIFAKTGFNGPVAVSAYHHFTDGIAYPYAYTLLPYYILLAAIVVIYYCAKTFSDIPQIKRKKKDVYLRGSHKISSAEFCAKARNNVHDPIASVEVKEGGLLPLSDTDSREHTLILGATGTGKSQLLISIIAGAMKLYSHPRFIFIDRKGEFYSLFGRPDKDVLINPYDSRCAGWSIFNEVNFEVSQGGDIDHIPPDLMAMADTVLGVKSHRGEDLQWYSAAASVFCSAFCYCVINRTPTTRALCDFGRMPLTDVIKALQSLPPSLRVGIGVLGTDSTSKTASSIMSVYNAAIRQLDCFSEVDGNWSIRDWMQTDDSSNLYISTAGRNGDNYGSIVTTLIDLSAREIKGFKDDGSHTTKIVYVFDELAALPRMQELIFLLTQARSKGVACILANQTMAKIRQVYGDREAENIVSNTKTKFIFQCPEATDAKYLSQTIGTAEVEREIEQRNESTGSLLSKGEDRKGKTWNKQIVQDSAFLPADLTSLSKGQAIALLPNLLPFVAMLQLCMAKSMTKCNLEFEPRQVQEIGAKFVNNDNNNLDTSTTDATSDDDGQSSATQEHTANEDEFI